MEIKHLEIFQEQIIKYNVEMVTDMHIRKFCSILNIGQTPDDEDAIDCIRLFLTTMLNYRCISIDHAWGNIYIPYHQALQLLN